MLLPSQQQLEQQLLTQALPQVVPRQALVLVLALVQVQVRVQVCHLFQLTLHEKTEAAPLQARLATAQHHLAPPTRTTNAEQSSLPWS